MGNQSDNEQQWGQRENELVNENSARQGPFDVDGNSRLIWVPMDNSTRPEHQGGDVSQKPPAHAVDNTSQLNRSSTKSSSDRRSTASATVDHDDPMPGAVLKNIVKEAVRIIHDQMRWDTK